MSKRSHTLANASANPSIDDRERDGHTRDGHTRDGRGQTAERSEAGAERADRAIEPAPGPRDSRAQRQVSSRIAGFYRQPLARRRAQLIAAGLLSSESSTWLTGGGGLDPAIADRMSENVVATIGLPLGLGLNFRVNHRDYLIPMATEEPSVVAAASHAARLVRISGGFVGHADPPVMTAQVQLDGVPDPGEAERRIAAHRAEILAAGDRAIPAMVARGGGCRDLEVRVLDPADGLVVVHVYIDVGDAMGANMVDTVAEAVGPAVREISGGRLGLRILSNLPLRRLVTVSGSVGDEALGDPELAAAIARASRFAELDPMRAATHNKGIMNGIDAVAVALGQDWRSIEAGAHAYAACAGRYRPLATWRRSAPGAAGEPSALTGTVTLPLAVGTVGGSTRILPGARAGLEILGPTSAGELAVVMAAVGLASNLAALRALAGEGIQRGHMRLHRRRQANPHAGEPRSGSGHERAPERERPREGSAE